MERAYVCRCHSDQCEGAATLQCGAAAGEKHTCVACKGFHSDWRLSWKIDGSSWSSGKSRRTAIQHEDDLYTWSSMLSLHQEQLRNKLVTCEAFHNNQSPVVSTVNTEQCSEL
ncbi:hypothetical protein C0J50_16180 [Silurus asotus]|uniref:Immunoglobulin C1-set domain-containing protein n=1 Tax=Silurus asotus TaxID=30991 RepID=A0AAD5AXY5_SILAS|nr:hypothetical protein C0J50_16180 [Silurus asotus]